MDLQPTLEQRLILINQYKILEKLYPEEAETYIISPRFRHKKEKIPNLC